VGVHYAPPCIYIYIQSIRSRRKTFRHRDLTLGWSSRASCSSTPHAALAVKFILPEPLRAWFPKYYLLCSLPTAAFDLFSSRPRPFPLRAVLIRVYSVVCVMIKLRASTLVSRRTTRRKRTTIVSYKPETRFHSSGHGSRLLAGKIQTGRRENDEKNRRSRQKRRFAVICTV